MRGTHTQTHLAFIGADKAHSQTAGSPTATITLTKHLSKHISKHLEIVCLTVSLCVSAAVKIYVCLWKCRILKSKVKVFFYSLSSNLPISLVQVPSPSHPFSHLSSHFFHFFSYCHFISSFIRLFPSLAFHVLLARGQPFLCVCFFNL